MAGFNRYTRECSFSQFRPELLQAMRDYIENQKLVGIEVTILMCCETTSEKKVSDENAGVLAFLEGDDPDTTVYTGMFVTPEWLVWSRSGNKSGIMVTSANLGNVKVKPFSSRLTEDTGLEVSGFIGDSPGRVKGYIGMGPEEAARKFCEEVVQAVEKVRKEARQGKRRIKLGLW
jgi:hypothetical protein